MINLHGLNASPETLSGLGFIPSWQFDYNAGPGPRTLTGPELVSPVTGNTIWGLLAVASAAASGYHGIKRNNGSVGWGIVWFFLGGLMPVLVPVIATAQGFAVPKRS
jgi:hypothetical protein